MTAQEARELLTQTYGDAYTNPNAYIADSQNKLDTLSEARNQKLARLGTKDNLLGLADADTVFTSGLGTIREAAANGVRYDAVEAQHGSWSGSKSTLANKTQDTLVAKLLNKPIDQINDQDRIDVSNYQLVQKATDLINGPGKYKAGLERGTQPVNLSGHYVDNKGNKFVSPLNLPITRSDTGKTDKFNRRLEQVGSVQGDDVTTASANNPRLNAFANTQPYANSSRSERSDDIYKRLQAIDKTYVGNLVDAVQYGLGSAAARVGDAAVDLSMKAAKEIKKVVTGQTDEQIGKAIAKNVKESPFLQSLVTEKGDFKALDTYKTAQEYGYDDSKIQEYTKNFTQTWLDPKASWADKAIVTLKGIVHAPEVLASSSGDMALAALGIPGVAVMAAGQTNEILADRQKITGKANNTTEDYAIAVPMGVLYAAVNRFTGGNAGLKETEAVVKTAMQQMDKTTAMKAMDAARGLALQSGKSGAVEGLEEMFQGYTEEIGTKLGTGKQNDILSKETLAARGAEGALGFGAGVAGTITKESPAIGNALVGAAYGGLDQIAGIGDNLKVSKEAVANGARAKAEQEAFTTIDDVFQTDIMSGNEEIRPESIDRLNELVNKHPATSQVGAQVRQLKGVLNDILDPNKPDVTKPAVRQFYQQKMDAVANAKEYADRKELPEAQNLAKQDLLKVSKTNVAELGATWADITPNKIDDIAEMAYMSANENELPSVERAALKLYVSKGIDRQEAAERVAEAKKIAGAKKKLAVNSQGVEAVAQQVLLGDKGVITYYNYAVMEHELGNKDQAIKNANKLSEFRTKQKEKLDIVASQLEDRELALRTELADELKASGKKVSESSIRSLAKEYKDAAGVSGVTDKRTLRMSVKANESDMIRYGTNYDGSDAVLSVDNEIVYENIATNGRTAASGGKVYKLLNTLATEVDAIEDLYSSLVRKLDLADNEEDTTVNKEEDITNEVYYSEDEETYATEEEVVKENPTTTVSNSPVEVIEANIDKKVELADKKMDELAKLKAIIDNMPDSGTKVKAMEEYAKIMEKMKECTNGL